MASRSLLPTLIIGAALCGVAFFWWRHSEPRSPNALTDNPAAYAEVSTTSSAISDFIATTTSGTNLPIIVYHVVRPSYPTDSAAVRAIAVTPEVFDAQMNYLGRAGYHIVQFSDLESHFASSTPLPAKPIIISFDDGWGDQFKYAFPILEKYHYRATFFVFTNALGHRGFLSWSNLQTLVMAGMIIGDHTRSHPFLTKIATTIALWNEIDGSKLLLEKNLGITVNEFAYPFGQYTPAIVSLVQRAGYKSARGDFYSGSQYPSRLFELSAMNVPTTLVKFEQKFPAN